MVRAVLGGWCARGTEQARGFQERWVDAMWPLDPCLSSPGLSGKRQRVSDNAFKADFPLRQTQQKWA